MTTRTSAMSTVPPLSGQSGHPTRASDADVTRKTATAAKDDWAPQGVGCPGACGLVLCQPPRSPTQPHGSAPVTPLGGYEPPPIDFAWLCPAGNTRFVDAKLISSQTAGGCWVR